MSHHIKHRGSYALSESELLSLYDLLTLIADDFVPSLQTRASNMDVSFTQNDTDGVRNYTSSLEGQENLLVVSEDRLMAFLSFNILTHPLFPGYGQCAYVSTIGVHPGYRNQKLGRVLYHHLLAHLDPSVGVLIRTWSSNEGHLRLLKKLDFTEVLRLPDDRGPAIDTVYLYRQPVALV